MSTYITFYVGDFVNEMNTNDNFDYDKAPAMLSINFRSDLGHCFMYHNEPSLATESQIKDAINNVNTLIKKNRTDISHYNEIRAAALANVGRDDATDAVEIVTAAAAQIEATMDAIEYFIESRGVLNAMLELIENNYPITITIG